jgi:hypothetical protein
LTLRHSTLELDGVDAFVQDKIPILRVEDSTALRRVATDPRQRALGADVPVQIQIPIEHWVFHLSLVCYGGDRWPELGDRLRALEVPRASCVVDEVEVVAFDGGPERRIARIALAGEGSGAPLSGA